MKCYAFDLISDVGSPDWFVADYPVSEMPSDSWIDYIYAWGIACMVVWEALE